MAISDIVRKGTKGYIYEINMRNRTTGQLLTGLAHTDVTVEYQRQGAAANESVVLSAGVLGTWSSGGWVETESNGVYQFGVPDEAIAAGCDYVVFTLISASALDKVVRIYLGGGEFDLGDEAITGVISGTLAEITLAMAREITRVIESTATSGSATTLGDTAELIQEDAHWKGGTVWFKETGEVAKVTAFSQSLLTFALQDQAVQAADRYALCSGEFPYTEMVKAVNSALMQMGYVIALNESLMVLEDTLSYAIPSGVSKIYKVKLVDTTDETVYWWSEHWTEEWLDGYTGYLRFDRGYEPDDTDYKIVLYYQRDHPELAHATDLLSPMFDFERLKWMALVNLYRWAYRQYGDDSRKIPQFLEEAIRRAETLSSRKNRNSPVIKVHVAG